MIGSYNFQWAFDDLSSLKDPEDTLEWVIEKHNGKVLEGTSVVVPVLIKLKMT